MVAIDAKLPALLSGKEQPKDIEEELDLAVLCQQPYKRLFAASARFYEHALTSRQQWADDLRAAHRYNAACSAALAAAGQGEDAKDLHDKERSRWRNQARTWLRADLAAWMKTLNKGSTESHNAAQQSLRHWQEDSDLDGLRNPMALSRLPAAEQEDCHKLWREVEAALNETAAKK